MSNLMQRVDEAWGKYKGSFDNLEKALLDIKDDVERESGKHSAEYVSMCNELGTFYRTHADYAKGEQAFFEALAGIEAIAGRKDQYATCMDNLSELYRLSGDAEKCRKTLLEAETYFTDQHSLEFAACINYQGHLAASTGDPAHALECYTKALDIVNENGAPAFHVSTAHANIASVNQQMGNLAEAADHLNFARTFYDSGELNKGAHYATLLNSLATLQEQLGNVDAATEVFDDLLNAVGTIPMSPIDALIGLINAGRFFNLNNDAERIAITKQKVAKISEFEPIHGHPVLVQAMEEAAKWGK